MTAYSRVVDEAAVPIMDTRSSQACFAVGRCWFLTKKRRKKKLKKLNDFFPCSNLQVDKSF